MTWREYHESTKHTPESLRRSENTLDWANMPDPFRHYERVPILDLPADPPRPEVPALELLLEGASGPLTAADGGRFLSQLLFYAGAISATKRVPSAGYEYALRVNPSSGNLHPTEFHFATRGLNHWPDGLYHYRPSSHMAEQRAIGDFVGPLGGEAVSFILTSIAWREAWKYRERAYRYCLHDAGHAWEALALSARAGGCDSFAIGHFADAELARICRFSADEWPMLVIHLRGIPIQPAEAEPVEGASGDTWFGGEPNQLSDQVIGYPDIDAIHWATSFITHRNIPRAAPPSSGFGPISLPSPATSNRGFGEVARQRRSALNFIGPPPISIADLSALLAATARPLCADFAAGRFVELYLYVHRVSGLDPGIYRYWPGSAGLELLRPGDQRVMAAALSLGQSLAGNACVAFSLLADIERAVRAHGDRGYRYVHFEAGAIGQRLYIAAESLGLGATGIGAFFDDEVHRYLGVHYDQSQVVYHFAIGHPVPDPRVSA
jgi:SagB-type dehydrogenase family enzyme